MPRRAAPQVPSEPVTGAELVDEADITGALLSGDLSGCDVADVNLIGCRIDGAQLLGAVLRGSHLTDCLVTGSDLSGLTLEECVCTRVEFRDCRLSGFQAGRNRFRDVGFRGCKLNGANFRMTTWERAEFEDCDLADADFYAAAMPSSRFLRCDLSAVQLSKAGLTGSRIEASKLDGLRGADALRGVTISGDEVLPVAFALFGALEIKVVDEP